jgi:quercetin dioxygenase-like cupin family protein
LSGDDVVATAGVSWTSVPASEPLPGVTRQVIQGERQTLVRYCYAPGVVFPVHQHPQEQITAVLRGRLTFRLEAAEGGPEQEIALGPGCVLVIPGDQRHGAAVVGGEDVETLNMLSPRRDDNPVIESSGQRP